GIEGQIDFTSDTASIRLSMDKRRHFYLLFKEAVNNLAKYSGCRSAYLSVVLTGDSMKMEISDDGRGFLVDAVRGVGNGIQTMHDRAEKIGAEIEIRSELNKGTSIFLLLKI
ncbi:MAG: ATP-binding protein, partial [Bacteroidota bacterium]